MKKVVAVTYVLAGILAISILLYFVLGSGNNLTIGDFKESRNNPSSIQSSSSGASNTPSGQVSTSSPNSSASGGGGGGGGGGSGGGGSSEGSGSTTSSATCVPERISYALRQFSENIVCLQSVQSICVDLAANCSVEVNNLDSAVSGDFTIELTLLDSAEQEIDSHEVTKDVPAGTNKIFLHEFRITSSSGVDEFGSCAFKTIRTPSRQVCY